MYEKVEKIDDNVFFSAAGGLTVRYTYSQVLFSGIAWLDPVCCCCCCFSFFRNVAAAAAAAVAAAAAAAVAVRRRRPSNTYLPTLGYLTCRVADFTILGTLGYETTNEHDECWIADLGHMDNDAPRVRRVCVCVTVYVCVRLVGWEFVFFN